IYFDDYSITPLDNVALSLKAWAPVSDSSAIGSSLSVHGNATGVQSLAAGVRNSAYTFDGSTGYLRQQTIATNIGTLSYSGNTFIDDAQTFTSYQAANPATHMIVITNSDNTTTWGYIGSGGSATTINVYTTKTESTAGFNGTSPTGKTPVGYEVRKTDFQITGNYAVGMWVKRARTGVTEFIFSKGSSGGPNTGYSGYFNPDNTISFYNGGVGGMVTASTITDTNWHYLVFNSNGASSAVYIDGISAQTGNMGSAPNDNPISFNISANVFSTPGFQGSIDEPFVTAEALTAGQIFDMYNSGR
ncbi:MAG: LamG-like jellyroll fold domain-containing protein, partial [Candidatus Roizmanbacteria bacterium]